MVGKKSLPDGARFEVLERLEKELLPGRLVIRVVRTHYPSSISYGLMIGRAMGGLSAVWGYDGFVVNAQQIESQQQDRNGKWIDRVQFHDKDIDFRIPDDVLVGENSKKCLPDCEFFVTRRKVHDKMLVEMGVNRSFHTATLGSELYCRRILKRKVA